MVGNKKYIECFGASIYLDEIKNYAVMTPEREKEIGKLVLSGKLSEKEVEALKKEMIVGNLKFVLLICKKYQNLGVDMEDLISEGNYGLLKAFDNFDWKKNVRFISYGKWWIMQSVLQLLNENSRTVRLPVNIIYDKKQTNNLSDKNIMHQKVELPHHVKDEITSNDIFIFEMDLEDTDSAKLKKELTNALHLLDEREKEIIVNYFGIECEPLNLEEIGENMNLTKERVRQIKEIAIRKLRNNMLPLFNYI